MFVSGMVPVSRCAYKSTGIQECTATFETPFIK